MNELLAKYFSQNTNVEEAEEVLKWRNENPSEFLEYKKVWTGSEKISATVTGLEAIIGRFDDDQKVIPINRKGPQWMKYAASIAMVVGVGYLLYMFFGSATTSDMIREVRLADGTNVTLYKGAKLEAQRFEDKRIVSLKGLAYFDVKRDESRPFIIYTEQARVEVLGTSFVVDAEKDHTTEVIVESGLVSFSQNPDNYFGQVTSVRLEQGDKGVIKPQARGIIKQKNRDRNYLAWSNHELTFRMNKLNEVGKLIEEVYGYQVVFDNEDISNCKLTAKYAKKSPNQLASLISETFDFTYEIKNRKITFFGQGCQ
jgi:ferric-dicitrate binding protein FerR (iron transport regulator)